MDQWVRGIIAVADVGAFVTLLAMFVRQGASLKATMDLLKTERENAVLLRIVRDKLYGRDEAVSDYQTITGQDYTSKRD